MRFKIVSILLMISICTSLVAFCDDIPTEFDLRDLYEISSVKDQKSFGSCWAVSSLAALESFLAVNGETSELSIAHMIGRTSNMFVDGFDRNVEHGGDPAISTAYYASWQGPVFDVMVPYPTSGRVEDYVYKQSETVKHVQEVLFIDPPKTDVERDEIKSMVMKYGGIDVAMWKGSEETFGPYYNSDTFAWYYPDNQPNEIGNGHAVTIMGWDDNYPKENFKIQPPKDGAYLVRNTKGDAWGKPSRTDGMGGYFYISYYDGMLFEPNDSLLGAAVFTRVDESNNYDHIHQYDPLGYTKRESGNASSAAFANLFHIGSMYKQSLEAVSFYTLEDDLDYEVWIKENYYGRNDLNSMTMIKSGHIDKKGYHTVDIDDYILESKNVMISVVLKGDQPSIAVEAAVDGYSSQATADTLSFIKKDNSWKYYESGDVCIKLFTNDYLEADDLLSVETMKKDVDFTVDWIKTHQPIAIKSGYTPKQNATIYNVNEAIDEPLTDKDFYYQINQLFTMMGDGHTNINQYFEGEQYYHLPFQWLNEGIFINQKTQIFNVGDEITRIGGMKPTDLNDMLFEQISAENKYWVRNQSPYNLTKWSFLDYFDLLNDDESLTVTFMRDNKTYYVDLPKERYSIISKKFNQEWYAFHLEPENNLGYFRFDQWASGDDLEDIKEALDDFFNVVVNKDISNIVFDIRNNGGGTSQTLNVILSYLPIDKVYDSYDSEYTNHETYKDESKPTYDGEIYVMINNGSYSCSVYATNFLVENNLVKTIGEPTAENPAFNKHGSGSDGNLPELGWRFMMTSHEGSRRSGFDVSEEAIYPDIPVYTKGSDLITGRDRQMEVLRTRLNNKLEYFETSFVVAFDDQEIILDNSQKQFLKTAYFEDFIGSKRTDLTVTDGKIKIPAGYDRSSCYLYLTYGNGDTIGFPVLFEEKESETEVVVNQPIRPDELLGVSYVEKWNYFTIRMNSEIVKSLGINKAHFLDANNERIPCKGMEKVKGEDNLYLYIPKLKPKKGKCTIVLEREGIKYLDGQRNEDVIQYEFIVK